MKIRYTCITILKDVFILINIIEDKLHRKLKLIDLLIETPEGISLDNISDILSVSKSTVQRDLELLDNNYPDRIIFEIDQNNMLFTELGSEELIYIKHLIIDESINIKFLTEILFNPFQKIKYFSEKLEISPSNIYKMIKKINQSLTSYQMEIVTVNNKYYIKAFSEITLRKLFSVLWVELNYFTNRYPSHIELVNRIDNYVKEIIKGIINVDIRFVDSYNISFIYISYLREIQLFYLEGESVDVTKNEEEIATTIIQSLLYSPFDNNPFFYNRKLFQLKEFLKDNLADKYKVEFLYHCLVVIYKNECSDQIPPSLVIDRYKSFYLSLSEKHQLFQPIKDILAIFTNILNINLKDYYHVLSYLLVVYFPELLEKSEKNTVYIYSNLSTSHAYFLQKVLMDKFDNLYEFIIVKNEYFVKSNQKDYLFVTNEKDFDSINNFVINDFPKQVDLVNLELKLTNFYYQKNQ